MQESTHNDPNLRKVRFRNRLSARRINDAKPKPTKDKKSRQSEPVCDEIDIFEAARKYRRDHDGIELGDFNAT